ncbi:unnamed protein product [Pleuronectes platessa]|uniref:Uncharacterized protein n=1 Tax=Pleuronectes platessa TaxID=8262 RepID=A0A9N7TUA1_PLEPL|nr:unnamed protein product [Pleuronectes platessa]
MDKLCLERHAWQQQQCSSICVDPHTQTHTHTHACKVQQLSEVAIVHWRVKSRTQCKRPDTSSLVKLSVQSRTKGTSGHQEPLAAPDGHRHNCSMAYRERASAAVASSARTDSKCHHLRTEGGRDARGPDANRTALTAGAST